MLSLALRIQLAGGAVPVDDVVMRDFWNIEKENTIFLN